MDRELYELARASIGAQHGLSPEQSGRLQGPDAKSLREDANRMRVELGLLPLVNENAPRRDEGGRFRSTGDAVDLNQLIRQAAGR